MTMSPGSIDGAPPPETPPASPSAAPMALVREVQGPTTDRGRVAGLAMVCSAAGVALGFALAGSLFAAMAPPHAVVGWSECPHMRMHLGEPYEAELRTMPWLGVSVTVGPHATPATLTGVVRGSPAADAGLRPGDLVTTFDGRDITSSAQFLGLIRQHRPGDTVDLDAIGPDGGKITIHGLRLSSITLPVR
ncbi:MAG TPA: PDZ domain-containing protein [Kofleriaceae bacterium]|nr:PDZ domain-containing protein [Kofleriaceae bacterium]